MKPQLGQLQETLAQGNKAVDSILVLSAAGKFKLVEGAGASAVEKMRYITRWGTFDAGSDYVGMEAAEDISHTKRIMDWAVKAYEQCRQIGKVYIMNPGI